MFICYVVTAGISQLVLILSLIFGWTLSVQDVLLISFSRKFCNLFLDQFGFWDCFSCMFCFWLWSACFGSIAFICYVVSAGSSFSIGITINWDIWSNIIYFTMCHWYLLVGNFVICFWINLVLKIAFYTCFVFDLICLFWVNSIYLSCCYSRKFSIGIDINFAIWLNIIC